MQNDSLFNGFFYRIVSTFIGKWCNYSMKTAISLPDKLFEETDQLAKFLGITRSELVQRALGSYLSQNKYLGVTAKLDEVYSKVTSNTDFDLIRAHVDSFEDEDWS